MAEGVLEATVDTAKQHPWLIGGGVVVLVLVIMVFGRSKATPSPASFQFSYGPTNAQIQAGTQLAIAEHEDQTRVSLANTQAGVYSNYFDYLTSSGKANATAATQQAQLAADTSRYTINSNNQTALAIAGIGAQTAQAATAAQLAATTHGQDVSLWTVNLNNQAANYQAGLSAQTKEYATYYAAATAMQGNTLNAQTTQQAQLLNAQTAQQATQLSYQQALAAYSAQTAQAAYGAQTAQAGYGYQLQAQAAANSQQQWMTSTNNYQQQWNQFFQKYG